MSHDAVMPMRLPALLPLLAILAGPALAQGGEVTAADPESVVEAIRAFGHKARLDTDDQGNPMVAARGGDINYVVYFYGCENGAGCLDLQFHATFDVETPLTPEFANAWNRDKVLGEVYVDENGDPAVAYVVTGSPAMPAEYFASVMEVWKASVDSFLEEIEW